MNTLKKQKMFSQDGAEFTVSFISTPLLDEFLTTGKLPAPTSEEPTPIYDELIAEMEVSL